MNNEVLEQLKQEYNETLKRAQDIGEIIANCVDIDINHCGQDCDCDDACCQAGSPCGRSAVTYDPNESQPVDTAPMSLHELTGMQVVGVYPKGWKCKDCIFSEMKDSRCEKKVELVGGTFLCLAKRRHGRPRQLRLISKGQWEDLDISRGVRRCGS